ncbi:MAG: TonB-dependent receptor [Cyclobacteriaceae bacterium]|nr:TonB-dependent receptor [Cyclobacteriaceae bacterium]
MKRLLQWLSQSLSVLLLCYMQAPAIAQEWADAKAYTVDGAASETVSQKSLKRMLKELEARFDVRFGYLDHVVENKSVPATPVNATSVEEALDNLLGPLNLVYRKLGDRFYLIEQGVSGKLKASAAPDHATLGNRESGASHEDLSLMIPLPGDGDSRAIPEFQVSGQITDSNDGNPVPGVNVLVKGTTTGTTSDSDGRYTVNAPDGNSVLIFSFIGYTTQEVPINSRSVIDIALTQDAQQLSEVVVVGYGTVEKKDLTGSVAVIDNDQLVQRGALNPLEAMQGQVAGVDISNASGRAGSGFNIQIRGQQSIEGGRPLYVVDGVITDGIEFLNPQDIERIDILKDASSTAIYGSRGAYGVVLVTTKQGSSVRERAVISYDGYYGVRKVARLPEFMDGDKWMNWRMDAYISEAITRGNPVPSDPGFNTDSNEMQRRLDENDFTDWPSVVTQDGQQANHWISLSGTSDRMGYTFGVGYQEEEGNVIREKYKRYNFKTSINHAINDKWSGGINLNLALINLEEGAPNAMVNAFRMNPLMSPYNTEDGEIIIQPGKDLVDGTTSQYHINFTSSVNPLVDMANANQETNTFNAIGNVYLQYAPVSWLAVRSTFAPRYRFRREGVFLGTDSEGRVGGQPRGEMRDTEDFSYVWDNQVSVNKQVKNHSFNFMGLFSMNMFRGEYSFAAQDRMDMSAKSFYNVGSRGDLSTLQVACCYTKETILSYALRLNYSFMDKYLVTLSNRWDGASGLAEGNKWASFPSAAIGWRVSQESFLADASFLDELKVRVSYGFTGNKVVDPYATLATASTGVFYDFGGTSANGIRTDGIANANLTWERTSELDFGLDFALFQSRVVGTFDVYNKESKDLIIERQLPFETGYGTVFQNIGEVTNKGFEVSLTTLNISTDALTWTTSFNFSKNNNEVTALYEDTNEIYKDARDGYSADDLIRVGYPLNSYYNWVTNGVWQADEADLATAYGQSEGQGRVVDFDDNGVINEDDKRMLGSKLPDWTGGFTTTLTFRNFDLSASLITRQGVFVYSPFHAEYTNHEDRGRSKLNIDWYMQENPVTSTRHVNFYPQPKNAGIYWRNSNVGYYRDASFTKIKNITLGYTFPAAMISQIGIRSLRVYANVLNPFVFTDYDGFDPEWADASLSNGGISSITYQFGVNLKF